jgi:hypothetical protein
LAHCPWPVIFAPHLSYGSSERPGSLLVGFTTLQTFPRAFTFGIFDYHPNLKPKFMNSDQQFYLIASAIGGFIVLYIIISSAVGGIKKELKKQTHILGLMAQQSGVTAEKLNEVVAKY